MSGDPLKHVQSGDPLRIRAETFNCLIDAARDYKQRTRNLGRTPRPSAADTAIISVKNGSGADQPRFAVLGLDQPIILPADNEDEFARRATSVGIVPAAEHAGRWCILAEPIPAGAIGRAYVAGVCPVRLDVQEESDGFAEVESGNTAELVTGGGGSATILWKEDGTGPGKWAVVRFGDARPVVRKAEMIDTLQQGDAAPALAWLLEYESGQWERTSQQIAVHGDRGFRGVAFGRTPEVDAGDQVDVYYSHEAREWYAIVGAWYFHGDVVDDIAAGAQGEVRLNVGAGTDTREITVPAFSPYGPVKKDDFVSVNWNTFSIHWDIGKFEPPTVITVGCGLQKVDDVISLRPSDLDGFGLRESDDEEDCELEVDTPALAGCGLRTDGTGNPLEFDPSAVVGFGLRESDDTEDCEVEVDTPALAGCGLATAGTGNPLDFDAASVAGFALLPDAPGGGCKLHVDPNALAGCGLLVGLANELVVDNLALAGPGLGISGLCGLQVLAGCGIVVAGGLVQFDASTVAFGAMGQTGLVTSGACGLAVNVGCGVEIDPATNLVNVKPADLAGRGLKPSGAFCELELDLSCHLAFDGEGKVGVSLVDFAGPGLIGSSQVPCDKLTVNAGCGLQIDETQKLALQRLHFMGDGLAPDDELTQCAIKVDWPQWPAGCHFVWDAGNEEWNLDVTTLAGPGLIVSAQACDKLTIDAGCGLRIDENDKLAVNRLHLAGTGLKPGDGPCDLAVDLDTIFGCGLVVDPVTDVVSVEPADLAGQGLVVGGGGCDLDVDAGDGLRINGLSGAVEVDPGCGLQLVGGQVAVKRGDLIGPGLAAGPGGCDLKVDWNAFPGGCGLTFDGNDWMLDNADLAGPGLSPDGDCGLKVNAGCGLHIDGDSVAVDPTALAGNGLGVGFGCDLEVLAGCGITTALGLVEFDAAAVAGSGLVVEGVCGLAVNPGCGIMLAGGMVAVDAAQLAGDGLSVGIGCALDVNVGCHLTVVGGVVDLDVSTLAGPGLIVSAQACDKLTVQTGCGLKVEDGKVVFDADFVAGDGLQVGEDECDLAVDWGQWPGDCHFAFDVDTWRLDVSTLAGPGLIVSAQACDALTIDAGCGLRIDENQKLTVDRIVLAGDGLRAGDGPCDLAVDAGCGLTVDGGQVAVDAAALASNDIEPAGGGCNLKTVGFTGDRQVVVDVECDPYDPYACPVAVIETWHFENGLLKGVT